MERYGILYGNLSDGFEIIVGDDNMGFEETEVSEIADALREQVKSDKDACVEVVRILTLAQCDEQYDTELSEFVNG